MDIKKLLYSFGIITLVLMAILYLVWDSNSDYQKTHPLQKTIVDSSQITITHNTQSNVSGYLLKVMLVTIFIIAVLIFGAKWFGKINKFAGNPSFIKVLSKQNIGSKQFLLLVTIEKRKILLGVTENSINHIADLGEYNEVEDIQYNSVNKATNFTSVLNYLRKGKDEKSL